MLAVLDGSNNVKEIYTHGPDLSGSLGGAGGIGGILAHTAGAAGPDTHYLHPDAMGNVVMTTDASGQTSSTVHYGPFGRILARSGEFQSRYLFSSKEWEAAAGLSYYGYRFDNTTLGRWINRDPLEERGGKNLYGFEGNNPLLYRDALGLETEWPISDPLGEKELFDKGSQFGRGIDPAEVRQGTRELTEAVANTAVTALSFVPPVGVGGGATRGVGAVIRRCPKAKGVLNAAKSADKFSRTPKSLMDEMVLDAAKQGKGTKIIDNLGDPQFKGMEKWSYSEKSAAGLRSEVHYVRDPKTGELMDFKFKHQAETYR